MRISHVTAATAGCLLTLFSAGSVACGESLFRVGKGVSFREYTAPLPGTVLVVARTDAELGLAASLEAAGHKVHVVADPDLIGNELKANDIDIVLAYFSQSESVLAQIGDQSVAYVPVVINDEIEQRDAARRFEFWLSSDDSTKEFLKAIHRTLKAQA